MKRSGRPFINKLLYGSRGHAKNPLSAVTDAADAIIIEITRELEHRDSRVREIRRRIGEGSYVIDPVRIAERILFSAWADASPPLDP